MQECRCPELGRTAYDLSRFGWAVQKLERNVHESIFSLAPEHDNAQTVLLVFLICCWGSSDDVGK